MPIEKVGVVSFLFPTPLLVFVFQARRARTSDLCDDKGPFVMLEQFYGAD